MRRIVAIGLAIMLVAACVDDDGGGTAESPSAAVSAGSTSSGAPTQPPPSGEVGGPDAFLIYREASGDLIAHNLSTGERHRRRVDFNNEVIVGLQCTQDGRRMAYLTQVFGEDDRNLDIRGEDPTDEPLSLPDSIQGISWSPDGTQMALSDYDGFDFTHSIGILDAETGEITELTSGEDFAGSIAWSPDGERLAYYLQSVTVGPVTPGAPTPVRTTDVHVISTDGGESEAITPGGAIAWYDPEWSPDGDTLLVAGLQEQNFQLYEIDAEGGEPRPLTQSDIFKRGARYSPDGSTIAYTGSVVEPAVSLRAVALHSFGIFLLESDGSNERAFTADPRENPGAQVDPYLDAYFMSWCAPGPWLDELWTPER